MTTLKEALEQGSVIDFIKEHRRDPKGDADALGQTINSMAGTSKSTRKTSSRDGSDD